QGQLTLVGVESVAAMPAPEIVRLAAALGSNSSHPVSRGLARLVDPNERMALSDVQEQSGLGVTALESGKTVALGRAALFESLNIPVGDLPRHDGPIVGVSRGDMFLGWLLLADKPR